MKMRRSDRARGEDFSLALIDRCSHGVMALTTGEETPYCLPLSFVRVGRDLYFHCARQGRKVDLLRAHPRVCVTFVGGDDPVFLEPSMYTTYFQSAVVTGTAQEVTSEEEKRMALLALCQKLTPDFVDGGRFEAAIARSLAVTAVWRISMEEISGKEKARKGES